MNRSLKFFKRIFKRRKENDVIMVNDVPGIETSEFPNEEPPEIQTGHGELHPLVDCDLSYDSILINLFNYVLRSFSSYQWTHLRLTIVRDYFIIVSQTCDFRELPSAKLLHDALPDARLTFSATHAQIEDSFMQELQEFFLVPRLKDFVHSIKKHQLVEAFISFLLRLLYHRTDIEDRICDIEKGLRFLLTILGDVSLSQCDEVEEFTSLLVEIEAVANEAGSFAYHLLFSNIRPTLGEIDEGIGGIVTHIFLLEPHLVKFLNSLSSFSGLAHRTAPKTPLVDSLLILDSLIYYLEDLMRPEDNHPIAHVVKDEISSLHQKLVLLQFSIKDIRLPPSAEIGELEETLMRVGDTAHEAEYLIISFLVGDAPLWYLMDRLTDINRKVELIGTQLHAITKRYRFKDLKVVKYFDAQLQAKRSSVVEDAVVVGFEDNITNLLHKLVGGSERLQVISIFGMAGIGKTTLAKKLYNHPSVNYRFDKQSWCVVSQTYQSQSILAHILINVKGELDKDNILKMEEQSLLEHIYKTLKGRRYLILLDDIWDSNAWVDWSRCFPDDGNGSRILFTTRNKDVAPPNSLIYALPSLSNDQCWELLEKKVFDNKPCPLQLVGIGKKIAANCHGLPLAVVVVAGILSTMDKEKSTWDEVGGNLANCILCGGDNSVMQILELSYRHLPDRLKPCFLYFGAFFQMDREISTGKLMRLCIGEGFVRKQREKSAESVAEEYLMELIDKSLVMVAKRKSDGGVKTCVLHDLLRDLCLEKSVKENFLKFVKSDMYSIYGKGHRLQAPRYFVASTYCQNARTFHGLDPTRPSVYVRNMRLLRVLYFEYNILHFPNFVGIEFLVNLRYLVIGNLPASIGSLVNLEYLRVETSETIHISPAIMNMRKLVYLHVLSDARYAEDCDSSYTNNLEFLSWITIRELKDEEMLKCSPHLRKLKCKCDPLFSGETRLSVLGFLTQLDSLNLEFSRYGIDVTSFPRNIRKLTLSRCNIHDLSAIGNLENLEILKLGRHAFMGQRWDTIEGQFSRLKFLKLEETNLAQWNVESSEHFPNLQQLVLIHCYFLEEIPCEIGEIATLQMIKVKGMCPMSMVESAKTIQQQQQDMGNEELRVIINV